MVTWSQVVDFVPEVVNVPAGAQAVILGYVDDALSEARWGGKYALGAILLCAHVAIAGWGGQSGPIASESVGGVAVSFAVAAFTNLDATPYGQQYRVLARQVGAGGFVAG